jgi:ABC-type spermidine/putrescine transport system permease subunit I
MTVSIAAPRPVVRSSPSVPRDRTLLLMLPALAMLVFMFVVPLALFFVRSFTEFDGTSAEFIDQGRDLLLSQAYLTALGTTNWISLIVTVTTLLIGYPMAYYLTTATGVGIRIVVLSIVLPYFTSIIVRIFSWMVLLGEHGLVNDVLMATGLIHSPLPLMYNRLGVLIGMSYVLLPYMVLTLYAAMRAIDPALLRASAGLGQRLLYLPEGVFSAEPARCAVRRADRLHPVDRLLHHAGADGRSARHHDRDADRPRPRSRRGLAFGGLDVADLAGRDLGALHRLLPRHRYPSPDRSALNHVPLGRAPLVRRIIAPLRRRNVRVAYGTIVIVVILAFSGDGYLRFPPTSLSLQWFARFFGNMQWQRALASGLIIGVIACISSTTIGFFAAYAFLRSEFRGKKLLLSLMLTPVIVPSIITAIAMYYLSGKLGLIGIYLWLGLCHAVIAGRSCC